MSRQRALGLIEQIEGGRWMRVGRAFVTNSALFPFFDAIRSISSEGVVSYLLEPSHYLLFAAAFVQAYSLGCRRRHGWQRLAFNLVGPLIYTLSELPLEGWAFFALPYHWVYWGFGLLMGLTEALQDFDGVRWRQFFIVLQSLIRAMLFSTIYYVAEVTPQVWVAFSWTTLGYYLRASDHQFIFVASGLLGLLLGVAEAQTDRYAHFLQRAARQLKQYADWGFGADLIEQALQDPSVMALQRVRRTILFMDIRNFTAWSERESPATVARMLEEYYDVAEEVIARFGGSPPAFIGDGVLTRFAHPDDAVAAAYSLREAVSERLQAWGLAVGIGIHMGEVIEGLMGGRHTRRFDAIGDAVNTASRLGSAAGPGEILISGETLPYLGEKPSLGESRLVRAKGKKRPLVVYALRPVVSSLPTGEAALQPAME